MSLAAAFAAFSRRSIEFDVKDAIVSNSLNKSFNRLVKCIEKIIESFLFISVCCSMTPLRKIMYTSNVTLSPLYFVCCNWLFSDVLFDSIFLQLWHHLLLLCRGHPTKPLLDSQLNTQSQISHPQQSVPIRYSQLSSLGLSMTTLKVSIMQEGT